MSRKDQKKLVREAFRESVFARDKYQCQVCGKQWNDTDTDPALAKINAHHITDRHEFPNGGYVRENGITVCDGDKKSCHMKCEQFFISKGSTWVPGLHPDDLYVKIGSSLEQARISDAKLTS